MKFIAYLLIGVLFGIVMTKSEAVSWFRIQEMFRFQSFHMYGIIISAVVFGLIINQLIRATGLKTVDGNPIHRENKEPGVYRYIFGGTIFGLGWAMTGACPGPIYVLVGNGFTVFLVVLLSAALGTFLYGVLKSRLPH